MHTFYGPKSRTRSGGKTVATLSRLVMVSLVVFSSIIAMSTSQASLGAKSNENQGFSTGSLQLAAVSTPLSANPGSSLTLAMPSKKDFFYIKNFGSKTLDGFTITQTLGSSTLRYCVNQSFKSGSTTQCSDNSSAVSVGNGINPGHKYFTVPLVVGNSYQFSATASGNGSNTISVTVSAIDYTPTNINS